MQRARAVEGKVWSSFKKISLSQAINRSINTVAFSDRNSKANTFPESDGKELRPLLRKEAADYTWYKRKYFWLTDFSSKWETDLQNLNYFCSSNKERLNLIGDKDNLIL